MLCITGQVYNVYLDKGNQAVSTKEGGMLYDDSYRGKDNNEPTQGR